MPIYNKDGKSLFSLYRNNNSDTLLLSITINEDTRLIYGTPFKDGDELDKVSKDDFNDVLRLARKAAIDLNMNLLVGSNLEERYNVQNFVIHNKKNFIPMIDKEIQKMNEMGSSVNILAHPTLFANNRSRKFIFYYKKDFITYENPEIKLVNDIKADIVINEEDIKDCIRKKMLTMDASNNDYSNIKVNTKEKTIELEYNARNGGNLKLPQTDDSCNFFIHSVGVHDRNHINSCYIPLPDIDTFRRIIKDEGKKLSLSYTTCTALEESLDKLNFRRHGRFAKLSDAYLENLHNEVVKNHGIYIKQIDCFMKIYKEFPDSINKFNDYKDEDYAEKLKRKENFDKLYSDLSAYREEILESVKENKSERNSVSLEND